jgi:hypothetical protein
VRTQEEIVKKIKSIEGKDLFGFQTDDLLESLDFDHAKQFLKEEATADKWQNKIPSHEEITRTIIDYLPFAFSKAIDHRGISAARSIEHMKAWLWLLGNDELLAFAENEDNYQNYGAPILMEIADALGVKIELDEEDLKIFEAMANGEICPACSTGNQCGCGR